jgi:hypothetical protein
MAASCMESSGSNYRIVDMKKTQMMVNKELKTF